MLFEKIAFIGAGKMAQAMVDPLISNGYQPAGKVAIYDVSTKSMEDMRAKYNDIQIAESIGEAVHEAEAVVLAVKPQNVNESFWEQFPDKNSTSSYRMRNDATVLSILAGTPIQDFAPLKERTGVSKIVRR